MGVFRKVCHFVFAEQFLEAVRPEGIALQRYIFIDVFHNDLHIVL
jgi:hypothetical protein